LDGFQTDKSKKVASKEVGEEKRKEKEALRLKVEAEQEAKFEAKRIEDAKKQEVLKAKAEKLEFKTVGKIDINSGKKIEEKVKKEVTKIPEKIKEVTKVVKKSPIEISNTAQKQQKPKQELKDKAEDENEVNVENAEKLKTQYKKLDGPKMTGQKIDLKQFERPKKKKPDVKTDADKKKRRRISKVLVIKLVEELEDQLVTVEVLEVVTEEVTVEEEHL